MADPLQNTFSVWQAIFLREMLQRLFGVRMAWAWLMVEPTLHILIIGVIFMIMRQRHMGGMDVMVWLMTGMLTFFLFRRTAIQALHSIDCNKAFFAFRQVRPFDVTFIRSCVELYLMLGISVCILGVTAFLGGDVFPHNILLICTAVFGIWLLGLGYGMITSVFMRLVPESKHILHLLMLPLYFVSGVIVPLSGIPPSYREYLLYNPLIHGIESVRLGFFPHYHTVSIDLAYLYIWALCSIVLGLILYRVYENRLVAL